MNPFKRDEAPFLVDIHKYAGRFRGVHGGTMSCWEVKNTMIEPFGDITKAVCTELGNCRFPRSTVVMFDLFLRGSSPNSAEVYVMLAGATEQHRKKAVKRLRKSSLTKNYPGLKMDHWDWPPDAPQVVMMGSDGDTPPWTTIHRSQGYEIRFSGKAPEGSPLDKLGNISYHIVATDRGNLADDADATIAPGQNRSSEGSLVVNPDASGEKLGVLSHYVVAGGQRYLLAPAHIFLGDEPDGVDEFSDTDDSDSDLSSASDAESNFDNMLRAGSATPPDLESQPASDSATDENPSDRMSVFDSTTKRDGKRPEISPLNVAPMIPCAKISSIDLDYALIPVPGKPFATEGPDLVADLSCLVEDKTACLPFQKDSEVFSSRTVERPASVTTPSQGLMTGKISTRPVMMRLPYSKTFSMLYPLELSSPVKPGDCGSVVLDRLSRVYGFIAAGSTAGNVAYIVPAAEILKDIRSRLGREPSSVSIDIELGTAELPSPTGIQAQMIEKESDGRPKASSWQLVLTDLPFYANEKFVRGLAPNLGLEGIVVHPMARKPTGDCCDATLSFASEAAALLAYNRLDSQPWPRSYKLMPPFNVQLPKGDELPKDLEDSQSKGTLKDTVDPVTSSRVAATGDGGLRDTIDHLVAEIEALRAKNAKLNNDTMVREAKTAADKHELETRAVTIQTLKQKNAALEEALQNSTNLARLSGDRITHLEREVERHDKRRRNERASLTALPRTAKDVLLSPWRTASPAAPENKSDWESPEGSPRGGRLSIQMKDIDKLRTLNAQLEASNNGLRLENERLKVDIMMLRDDNRNLMGVNTDLAHDLNQLKVGSLSESNLQLLSGSRTVGSASSSSGSSRYSRTSGASSVGSRRSVVTAASSVSGSTRPSVIYTRELSGPIEETFQIGDVIIKGTGITFEEQTGPGRRSQKVYHSAGGDGTVRIDVHEPARKKTQRRLLPSERIQIADMGSGAVPGPSAPSAGVGSVPAPMYGPGSHPPSAYRFPSLPLSSRPVVDRKSMPPPPLGVGSRPTVELASSPPSALDKSIRDPYWRRQLRACDNCQQRKADCVREAGRDTCVGCGLFSMPCTYTDADSVDINVSASPRPIVADWAHLAYEGLGEEDGMYNMHPLPMERRTR